MIGKLIACVAVALVATVSANWRDPDQAVSLQVDGNYTGALVAGEVVEIFCRSEGIPTWSTHTWFRLEGSFEFGTWSRGHANVSHVLQVTPELHGVEFYCSVPYSEQIPDTGRWRSYTVLSRRIKLAVQGATEQTFGNYEGRIEMTSNAASTTHRVGEVIGFTCTTYDMQTTVVRVVQVKGLYETQLHSGWQPVRHLQLNMTAADHGTGIYCAVSIYDFDLRVTYSIVSNTVPINIET